jgi:hypothetical protein
VSGDAATLKGGRRRPNFKCNTAGGAQQDKILVVGGGSGAIGLIEGLRGKGYEGPLTVISSEGYLPIDRPKLSKALIPDEEKLAVRGKDWYEAGGIEWVDDEVTDVDFSERFVTTRGGGKFMYTKLVLSTGGTCSHTHFSSCLWSPNALEAFLAARLVSRVSHLEYWRRH